MKRLVGAVLQFFWIRIWLWTPRHSGNAALDRSASAGKTHDRFISAPEDLVVASFWTSDLRMVSNRSGNRSIADRRGRVPAGGVEGR